jgi:hypothetical protein
VLIITTVKKRKATHCIVEISLILNIVNGMKKKDEDEDDVLLHNIINE